MEQVFNTYELKFSVIYKKIMYPSIIKHEIWMKKALKLAIKAKNNQEIPVGAILIYNEEVIGTGWNQSISLNDPTAHAEIIALRKGGEKLKNYRLKNAILYVTLEPCIMCIGAILHSRISHIIFGAKNKKFGYKTLIKLPNIYKNINFTKGILQIQSSNLLKKFFHKKRKN